MAKIKFDQEAAFKSIIGTNEEQEEKAAEKNNLKAQRKKRVSLALRPINYENLQKIAYVNRQSVSSIIDVLIDNYVTNNAAKLEEYNKIKME